MNTSGPRNAAIFFILLITLICSHLNALAQVKPGIDVLIERRFDILQGKRVGLITNPTGVTSGLVSTVDVLHEAEAVHLVALFGPEHGVRGNVLAGKPIAHYTDPKTGLPVYSLYGKVRKPTPDMLQNIDILVYDIQDIGIRAYTYIYTMALSMQAAAEKGIPFVVLDRPNPLGADRIEGPVLEKSFASFIGMYPIPYIYGMTVGELASYFNTEFGINCQLIVVPMKGYRRTMLWEDTGLQWVAPSPHIPNPITAFFCAATGIIGELRSVSEGVGYTLPFQLIGQTWIDPDRLAEALNRRRLPGVYFRPCYFRPYYFAFRNKELGGVQIHILDIQTFSPMLVQLHLIDALLRLYPEKNIFRTKRIRQFDQAMGTDRVRKALQRGESPETIIRSWQPAIEAYKRTRQKYMLYPQ